MVRRRRQQRREATVVVEAALLVRPQAAQRRRAVHAGRASGRPGSRRCRSRRRGCRFQPGSVNSGGTWQVAQPAFAVEERLAALGRRRVEAARRRLRRRQRAAGRPCSAGELRRDQVAWRVGRARTRCSAATGNCVGVVEARVDEGALAVHLQVRRRTRSSRVTEPQPVHVCRLTPARPNAGGISVAAGLPSGRNALPSRNSSASNLPGPQLCSTVRTVASSTPSRSATGCRSGARGRRSRRR